MTTTILLTNGRIHTMNPEQVIASAVVVRDGRILAVGGDELLDWRGDGVEWIDLAGRGVTPGLVDAHVHFHGFALHLQNVALHVLPTREAILDRIRSFATPPPEATGWVPGRVWRPAAVVVSGAPDGLSLGLEGLPVGGRCRFLAWAPAHLAVKGHHIALLLGGESP